MADDTTAIPSKTNNFYKKHKTAVFVVGGIIVFGVIYLLIRAHSASSASTGSSTDTSASGTGTGGSPYYGGDSGGVPGPEGPAGPTGAAGATGATGKTGSTGKTGKPGKTGPPGKSPKVASLAPATLTSVKSTRYTVKPGETSASVAAKHGMDVSTLHGKNAGLVGASSSVHPGQRVRVK